MCNRWLTHQRITQPFLPNYTSRAGITHYYSAALGIESYQAILNHGSRGAIVTRPDLPRQFASMQVERVKLMRPIAAANEQQPVVIGGCGDWTIPWNRGNPP